MELGVDVSKWQRKIDWKILKEGGIKFAIVKATQGNYGTDSLLKTHAFGALEQGISLGLYHWCDPLVDDNRQADYFLNAIKDIPHSFRMADVEQQWADWKQWPNQIVDLISPVRIATNAYNFIERIKSNEKRVVLYTRCSFIIGFANVMLSPSQKYYIGNYDLNIAAYPYAAGVVRPSSWSEFTERWAPKQSLILPKSWPKDASNWKMWQFTGDKFIMPGCEEKIDINFYNGTDVQLKEWLREKVPVHIPTIEERVKALENEAVERGWNLSPHGHIEIGV